MKICLTVNSSPWSRFKGGGQIAVHHLATTLFREGHDVHVIYSKDPNEVIEVETNYTVHWARHFNIATLNLNIFSFGYVLLGLVSREHFDIIHGNAEEAFFFSLIARVCRSKYVFTSHAPFIPKTGFLGGLIDPIFLLKRLNFYFLRSAAKRARLIFTFSQFSKDLVVGGLGPAFEGKVHIVHPGIDPEWIANEKELSLNPELIFWGRLEDEKGIPELLQAFKQIQISYPQARLHIIGEGNKRKQYRQLVANLHLSSRVDFYGWMKPREISDIASRCWAGIFPSRIESFGLSVIEAMAIGLPVITTSAGALPEIVENEKTGYLVSPNNIPQLIEAILKFLDKESSPYESSRSIALAIQKKFSWASAVQTITFFYKKHV